MHAGFVVSCLICITLSVVIMFGYFGLAGFAGYGEPSHTLSVLSLCLIPIMLIVCRPSRRWMRARWKPPATRRDSKPEAERDRGQDRDLQPAGRSIES
jgi:hypothetical protein